VFAAQFECVFAAQFECVFAAQFECVFAAQFECVFAAHILTPLQDIYMHMPTHPRADRCRVIKKRLD